MPNFAGFTGTPLGQAFVQLDADMAKLSRGFADARKMTDRETDKMSSRFKDKFNTAINNVAKGMEKYKQQITTLGRSMVIAGGAITVPLGLAARTTGAFQQSIANVQSVAGATGEELQKLTKYARMMGKESVYSATEAANAMYYLASSGLRTTEIMGALKGTLNLASATQSDLASTTATVTAMLASFGMESREADRISNVFAATISASQATMEKLSTSMQYVAPVANSVGLSLEQTSAILGQLYNAGIDASTAGTSLRMGIAQLLDPTEETTKRLQQLGVALYDGQGKIRPFIEVIRDLEAANMEAADALAVFGTRAGPGMLALLKQGSDSLDALITRVTGTTKATSMADTQINTFQGALKLLRSAVEELQISVGTQFLPMLTSGVKAITGFTNALSTWTEAHPRLTSVLSRFALVLGPMVTAGGMLSIAALQIHAIGLAAKTAIVPLAKFVATLTVAKFASAAAALSQLAITFVGVASGIALYAAATKLYMDARKNVFDEQGVKADVKNIKGYIKAIDDLESKITKLKGDLAKYQLMNKPEAGMDYSVSIGIVNKQLAEQQRKLKDTITEMIGYRDYSGKLNESLTAISEKYSDVATIIKSVREAHGGLTPEVEKAAKAVEKAAKAWRSYAEAEDEAAEAMQKIARGASFMEAQEEIATDLGKSLEKIAKTSKEYLQGELAAYKIRFKQPEPAFIEIHPEIKPLGKLDTKDMERSLNETTRRLEEIMGTGMDEMSEDEQEWWRFRINLNELNAARLKEIQADYWDWLGKKGKETNDKLMSGWNQLVNDWPEPEPLIDWIDQARNVSNSVERSMSDLFASMIDPSVKPAWAQFWDDLKSIAIRSIAEILAKLATAKISESLLGIAGGVAGGGVGGALKSIGGILGGIAGFTVGGLPLGGLALGAAGIFGAYKLFEKLTTHEDKANQLRQRMADSLDSIANESGQTTRSIDALSKTFLSKVSESRFRTSTQRGDAWWTTHRISETGGTTSRYVASELGSRSTDITRPSRSRFQYGGLVTRPQVAMVGEAGPEAIIPLRGGKVPVSIQHSEPQTNITMSPGAIQITEQYPNVRLDTMTMDQRLRMYQKTLIPVINDWINSGMSNRMVR